VSAGARRIPVCPVLVLEPNGTKPVGVMAVST
jgi:hypothetical protein